MHLCVCFFSNVKGQPLSFVGITSPKMKWIIALEIRSEFKMRERERESSTERLHLSCMNVWIFPPAPAGHVRRNKTFFSFLLHTRKHIFISNVSLYSKRLPCTCIYPTEDFLEKTVCQAIQKKAMFDKFNLLQASSKLEGLMFYQQLFYLFLALREVRSRCSIKW